jgi:thermostable 8-oxoguanine DNA glycosylase
MVDPNNITNYNLSDRELQEVLLFWVCVAGKKADTIAKGLDRLLKKVMTKADLPFDAIKRLNQEELADLLKECGIGCYTIKAKSLTNLVNSGIDLRNCGIEDLESIYGIGQKTARCFLIHSRPNMRLAGLDTHILKFLRDKGHDVPKSTPQNKKRYRELEQVFIKYADEAGKLVADFDLELWRKGSNGQEKRNRRGIRSQEAY